MFLESQIASVDVFGYFGKNASFAKQFFDDLLESPAFFLKKNVIRVAQAQYSISKLFDALRRWRSRVDRCLVKNAWVIPYMIILFF